MVRLFEHSDNVRPERLEQPGHEQPDPNQTKNYQGGEHDQFGGGNNQLYLPDSETGTSGQCRDLFFGIRAIERLEHIVRFALLEQIDKLLLNQIGDQPGGDGCITPPVRRVHNEYSARFQDSRDLRKLRPWVIQMLDRHVRGDQAEPVVAKRKSTDISGNSRLDSPMFA